MNLFLVTLKMEGGGSAVVACTELAQDPLFPDKVILGGVHELTWPYQDKTLQVRQWSVNKDRVLYWMVGLIEDALPSSKDSPLHPILVTGH